jgi:hypothetical protein
LGVEAIWTQAVYTRAFSLTIPIVYFRIEAMTMTERAEFDRSRDEANLHLGEISKNVVHEMCEGMITVMFDRFQRRLDDDRDELEMYEISGMPEGKSAELYIAPTSVDAPMTGATGFNEALSLKLVFMPPVEGTDPEREGDEVFVYMPIPRTDYHYPDPLDVNEVSQSGRVIQEGDLPTEMYFEYVPRPDKSLPTARLIMQRDVTDEKERYRIFRYTVPFDGDEMKIFGAIDIELESIGDRITEDSEDAMRLLRLLANFNEVKQTEANPHPQQ